MTFEACQKNNCYDFAVQLKKLKQALRKWKAADNQ